MQGTQTFTYSYSAKEQEEIKRIRDKYVPAEETDVERLRRLDRRVEGAGAIPALAVGLAGTLIFGAGMSFYLVWSMHVVGIMMGVVGTLGIGAAYPVYKKMAEKKRRELAPEILELIEKIQK